MNEKKGTMLNLEVDLVEKAKELGINMSNVVNTTLRYLIEGGSLQPIRTDLLLVQQDIKRVNNEMSLRKLELEGLQNRLSELINEEKTLEFGLTQVERDTKIAKILEKLRSSILSGDLPETIITSPEVFTLGGLLQMEITKEWLMAFKERVMKHE
jgi:antitoxin component of RelBE/YafQ-DinJ toxin-antitoxin module